MARGTPGANPFGPIYMLIAALTLGLGIAILVIVNQYLWEYFYYYYGGNSSTTYYSSWQTCYLQVPSDSVNMCYYSWAAAAVGLFFSLWLFFMQMCSGRSRHIPVCEAIVCLLASAWWLGCAITAMIYGKDATTWSNDNINSTNAQDREYAQELQDKEGYRTSVWAMAWGAFGLFALATLITLFDCAKAKKNPPPVADPGNYPGGAYAAPEYQQPYPPAGGYYAAPAGAVPAYGAPPAAPAYGATPAYGAAPTGYPPQAAPVYGAAPTGYPPQ